MFNALTNLFKQMLDIEEIPNSAKGDINLAIACLLYEVANADHQLDEAELETNRKLLSRLLGIEKILADELMLKAAECTKNSVSLYDFTSQLRSLSELTRYELIKAMWEVANADGHIDPLEDMVIRKTADLLYVDHSEFIRAKLNAKRE